MPGALVEVEGIVVNTFDAEGNAIAGRMDVSSAADVRLVSSTPVNWWRVVALAAGSLLALALLAFTVYRLRIHRQLADERLIAADRRRIADDLHDNMQQLLAGVGFRLTAAANVAGDRDATLKHLAYAEKALDHSKAGLRSVLWGLQETKESPDSLAGLLRYAASRMPHWEGVVEISSEGEEPARLRRHGARLLMIMQEAVGNALTHGDATRVGVRLAFAGASLKMTIADNGCGFEIVRSEELGVRSFAGLGLASMRRRAREMGGTFAIESGQGKGTTVTVEVGNGR